MESERHIEKLLRAYAKKRRDAAGPSPQMHPATRRLLQGEIARRTPPRPASSWHARFRGLFRPGLVYGLCCLALAVVLAGLLVPALNKAKSKSETFAENTLSPGTADNEELRKDQPSITPTPVAAESGQIPAPPPATAAAGEQPLADLNAPTAAPARAEAAVTKEVPMQPSPVAAVSRDQGLVVSPPPPAGVAASDRLSAGGGAATPTLGARSESDAQAATGKTEVAAATDGKLADRSYTAGFGGKVNLATSNGTELGQVELAKAEVKMHQVVTEGIAASATPGSLNFDDQAAAKSKLQASTDAQNWLAANSQRYIQTPGALDNRAMKQALAPASAQNSPVLGTFSLVQNGPEIRVIDADGSVYRGTMQWTGESVAGAPTTNQFKQTSQAPPIQNAANAPTQNYLVSWNGLNRSLNQTVSFSGNLQSVGAAPVAQPANGVANNVQGNFQALKNDLSQLPLANSRISGTAVINNKQQIQVNAVSSSPPSP